MPARPIALARLRKAQLANKIDEQIRYGLSRHMLLFSCLCLVCSDAAGLQQQCYCLQPT
jgi:hypothetical protein